MKTIRKIIAAIALAYAKSAYGATSGWNIYQPKEPDALRKLMK